MEQKTIFLFYCQAPPQSQFSIQVVSPYATAISFADEVFEQLQRSRFGNTSRFLYSDTRIIYSSINLLDGIIQGASKDLQQAQHLLQKFSLEKSMYSTHH